MTLRSRLILFFICLIGLLGLAQWWLLATLTEQLEEGRRQDALTMGQAIIEQLSGIDSVFFDGMPIPKSGFVISGHSEMGGGNGLPPGFVPPEEWLDENGEFMSVSVISAEQVGVDGLAHGFPLDLPLPDEALDLRMQEFRSNLILGTMLIMVIALLVMVIAAHKIGVPLRELAHAANQVESGKLGVTASVRGGAEVGEVIQAFNAMSLRLEELQKEADRLKEQAHLTELGELARGLAHAMRNPLHVIGLSAQRLIGGELTESRRDELAQTVHAQVKRVDRAMRNFLALSSAGSGNFELVALADVCRDVALELMQSGDRAPEIKIDADANLPKLFAVSAEVRALVHVLMVNAAEADSSEIEIRICAQDQGLQLEVLDRGMGLADDLQDKLFTPHFTTKEHGAGLGLYLARRIAVNRYRGGLELDNRAGGGCKATLCLNSLPEA